MVEGRREEEWKGKESRKIYSSIKINNKKKKNRVYWCICPSTSSDFLWSATFKLLHLTQIESHEAKSSL